jgi:cell shape-determining protein MreC
MSKEKKEVLKPQQKKVIANFKEIEHLRKENKKLKELLRSVVTMYYDTKITIYPSEQDDKTLKECKALLDEQAFKISQRIRKEIKGGRE